MQRRDDRSGLIETPPLAQRYPRYAEFTDLGRVIGVRHDTASGLVLVRVERLAERTGGRAAEFALDLRCPAGRALSRVLHSAMSAGGALASAHLAVDAQDHPICFEHVATGVGFTVEA